jgi:hypothetical protein
MKIRKLRFVHMAVLAYAPLIAQLGCVGPTVVAQPMPSARGHVVDYCHQTIQPQAADRFGRRVGVRFDTPETYFVSSAVEGVRGGALVAGGGVRERIEYDCTVNIRRGLVTEARYRYR